VSRIDGFLRSMYMRKGSDLHVVSGDPPRMRVHGDLITLDNNKLELADLQAELFAIMSEQ
jgi:twitching motility protein PilT